MSQFYMTMNAGKSNSATVTRRAHAGHGATSIVASYKGAIEVTPYVNDKGVDCVRIVRRNWQGSQGANVIIYDGSFSFASADGQYSTDLS